MSVSGGLCPEGVFVSLPPPVDKMTDASENIAFPLRSVKMPDLADLSKLPILCNYGITRLSSPMKSYSLCTMPRRECTSVHISEDDRFICDL